MMDFPRYVDNPQVFYPKGSEDNNAEGLRIPRIPSQNIVSRLSGRELWGDFRRPGTSTHLQRSMYQSIFPNFTVTQVDKPTCFLRKFTPDGKHLIAISEGQNSIEVYRFCGPQPANALFVNKGSEWLETLNITSSSSSSGEAFDNNESKVGSAKPSNPPPQQANSTDEQQRANVDFRGYPDQISLEDRATSSNEIRQSMFESFFKLKFRVQVTAHGEKLNRDCSLFTEDYRHVIVGSSTSILGALLNSGPRDRDTYQNNESLNPNPKHPLEDYSIHLVDIQHGVKLDTKTFKTDRIMLSNHTGIYLYKNKLAVLSVQHQIIHIFHVEDGRFLKVQRIGRFCHQDDDLLFSQVVQFSDLHPKQEMFMHSLKQRLLTYMFKNAYDEAYLNPEKPDMFKLSRFYQYYDQLSKLRLWKVQLLDEDHLLLKYSSEDVVTFKCHQPYYQHCLFVFYNIPRAEVLAVYENTTESLVDLFDSLADHFRNNFLTQDARYISSPSNCIYSKQILEKSREATISARSGDSTPATKHILAALPISAQSFSPSPYLDLSLFSFDESRVSAYERPRECVNYPIKFHGRNSRIYKFQLHTGMPSTRRPLECFLFHPSAPFAISLPRAANYASSESVAHFHLRLDPFAVMPL